MLSKPKILFIGDYCRKDYISLFHDAADHCELKLLFYTSPKEETSVFYRKYGESIFWKDYEDVYKLLSIEKPDKVIFLYIESYNHVVLNLACKELGISTFLLEHGLRADYVLGFDPSFSPSQSLSLKQQISHYIKVLSQSKARIRGRLFLLNSIKKLPPDDANFVKHFIKIRRNNNYLGTFEQIKSPKRLADFYISFSPKIYEVHQEHDALDSDQQVYFIGLPYFDNLASIKSAPSEQAILFIDQPLAEQGLLKWDIKYKSSFVENLTKISQLFNYKLYVKPHPKQDLKLWLEAEKTGNCKIITDMELVKVVSSVPVIIGFYSTLLMPFVAMPHTTVITLENHPAGKLDVSKSFIDAGVAKPVYDLQELHSILPNIEKLHQQQLPNKAKFTEEWMYKFDGKAGERLRDILLSNDL